MPESRRENYLKDRPSRPPTSDPGLIPETRRETLSKRSPSLSSDNGSRINTRSQTGNPIRNDHTSYPPITGIGSIPEAQQGSYPPSANHHPLRVIKTRFILTLSYYQQQLQSLAYDSVALDGILSPSPTICRCLSAFRMLHI